MLIARFPFRKVGRSEMGEIRRPYGEVLFYSSKRKHWVPVEMLIDTGADYTMLPKIYANLLGINLDTDCKPTLTKGIGGSETVYFYKSLRVKMGEWQKEIPVGFLQRNDVPALLGRMEFLEILRVVLENFECRFEK